MGAASAAGGIRRIPAVRSRRRHACRLLTVVCLAWLPVVRALGGDLAGPDPGGDVGRSQLEARAGVWFFHFAMNPLLRSGFSGNVSAFDEARAGLQPISPLGTELERIDVRHAIGGVGRLPTDVSMMGAGAVGMLELPMSSRGDGIYAMAGRAPPKGILDAIAFPSGIWLCPLCGVQPLPPHRIEMGFTVGAGARFRLGTWALRVQCGRFIGGGGQPRFVSVGFSRSFF